MQSPVSARNWTTNNMLFILGTFIFSYTALRAYILPITWDEAFTYLEFVRKGIFIPDKVDRMSANNHLLNTGLEIFLVKWWGVNNFVLRLPALFGHILFLFYSAKLVKPFSNSALITASFLIINLNPYLLDFFSLARGYGLSLGFMMAGIYYVWRFQNNEFQNRDAVFISIFGALAVLSNFVMLNFYFVSYGIIVWITGYNLLKSNVSGNQKIVSFIRKISLPTLILLILSATVVPIIFKLKAAGALFYGGTVGFWRDTFCETITVNCYEIPYNIWLQRIAKGIVLLILFAVPLFIGVKQYKKQTQNSTRFIACLFVLMALPALFSIVQHFFLGIPFLVHRTTLFLVVLFTILFVFFMVELSNANKKALLVVYLTSVVVVMHFALSFNLKYVIDWKPAPTPKEIVNSRG